MKWLVLLGLIIMIAAFIAARYRRQLQTAVYVWKMFRKMRRMNGESKRQIDKKDSAENIPLVRCAKCGKWIAQNKALNLRSKNFFCSTNCMEQAVKVG
jgi:hypothetical protein